jgi:hypothetical protein
LMNLVCPKCDALYFKGEKTSGKYMKCCNDGRITQALIPLQTDIPEPLNSLLRGTHRLSRDFKSNSRKYNNALTLASMQYVDKKFDASGPPCVVLNGQIRHRVCPILNKDPKFKGFAQLYVIDPDAARLHRSMAKVSSNCNQDLLAELDQMLRMINPYIHSYMTMMERIPDIRMHFVRNPNVSQRIMAGSIVARNSLAPIQSEVALFYDQSSTPGNIKNQICLHSRDEVPRYIRYDNPICDPLCYILLFPRGERDGIPS